jgi:hypothetical protein
MGIFVAYVDYDHHFQINNMCPLEIDSLILLCDLFR